MKKKGEEERRKSMQRRQWRKRSRGVRRSTEDEACDGLQAGEGRSSGWVTVGGVGGEMGL